MIVVKNLDTGTNYYFSARTPYEAMTMMREYLAYKKRPSRQVAINKTDSNRFLYMVVDGETYSTKME